MATEAKGVSLVTWKLFLMTTKGLEFVCEQELHETVKQMVFSSNNLSFQDVSVVLWAPTGKIFFTLSLYFKELDPSGDFSGLEQVEQLRKHAREVLLDALFRMRSITRICAFLNSAEDFEFESKETISESRARLERFLGTESESCWENALELYGDLPDDLTFRATCSRDRNFKQAIGSPDMERDLGGAVHDRFGWKVDCKHPKLEVYAEVNDSKIVVGITLNQEFSASVRKRFRHPGCNHKTMLHPALAYSLVRLCDLRPGEVFCDPLGGTGTIPIEAAMHCKGLISLNGDLETEAVSNFRENVQIKDVRRHVIEVLNWDAASLSRTLRKGVIDVVCSDLPFGHRCGSLSQIHNLYPKVLEGISSMLRPGGRAILLAMYRKSMYIAVKANESTLKLEREVDLEMGKAGTFKSTIFFFRKIGESNELKSSNS